MKAAILLSLALLALPVESLALQAPARPSGIGEIHERAVAVFEHGGKATIAAATWSAEIAGSAIAVRTSVEAQGLHLEPLSVGRESWSRPLAHARLRRSAQRLSRAVAPSIEERIDVLPDGLELSYVFATLPPGAGDLTVRVAVDTELGAEPGRYGDEGLHFTGSNEAFHVGAVLGIDATGARAPGELRWDGRVLELVLPGAFVDAAVYPLVLDPPIRPIGPVIALTNDTAPDVAYDASSGTWACVWDRAALSQHAAVMQLTLSDGTPLGGPILLGLEPDHTLPVVANCAGVGRFVFGYRSAHPDLPAPFVIAGTVRASDGDYDRGLNAVVPSDSEVTGFDVGGDFEDHALVVLAMEPGDIQAHVLKSDFGGSLDYVGDELLHTGSTFYGFGHEPRVSSSGGPEGNWCVVWEVEGRGLDPELLGYAMIDRALTLVWGPSDLEFDPYWSYRDVDCASNGDQFLFSYVRDSGTPDEIWVRRLSLISGSIFATGIALVDTVSPGQSISGTAVDYAGNGILVTWREQKPTGARIRSTSLEPVAVTPCAPITTVRTGNVGEPRLFAITSSAGEAGPARIVWTKDPFGTAAAVIQAALREACP